MMKRIITAVGAISLLMLAAAVALAGDIVVLQSNTPNYSSGEVLSADTVIELADGDELMLASESGGFTLSGPYAGPPEETDSADEQSVLEALDELRIHLIAMAKSKADRLGIVVEPKRCVRRSLLCRVDQCAGHHQCAGSSPTSGCQASDLLQHDVGV